jgi:4-diphosphocytidyl-2-C-methyl-D-erythritol kinase
MRKIKVKTPAKINLTLEILNRREDGFHNIQSIMQAVDFFDFLTISVFDSSVEQNIIELDGNSKIIPYDNTNLVWKAADKFLKKADIRGKKLNIYIEKNIPVAAGLAGGSSNAAGTLVGLNSLFDNILSTADIDTLASELGSDVNFCLYGSTQLATSRGEILEKVSGLDFNICIVKPKNLFISAKEAYRMYSELEKKPEVKNTKLMIKKLEENDFYGTALLLNNDLERAILPVYNEIEQIKNVLIKKGCVNALMSGSGSTVFGILDREIDLSDIKYNNEVVFAGTYRSGACIC